MKFVFSCLVLAALPAFGGDRQIELPAILYTSFQQSAPPAVARALEDELEAIMGPLGRHFVWRAVAGVKGNEVSSELAVLTFKGRCDVAGLMPRNTNPGVLGWTHVSDGAILPFSEIECDHIRSFVQKELLYLRAADREEVFGRAVARVVAHELYHIFANTQHHGSDGIAKSSYTVQELLSDDFQFEEREEQSLRTSATHPAIRQAASTP